MVRLYVTDSLKSAEIVPLNEDQVHYLRNVLRQGPGDTLTVFNGTDGEWSAQIHHLTKSRGDVTILEQIRPPLQTPFVGLIFAPLKHDPLLYLIEKCTELGVSCLQPALMERSVVHKFNQDKMQRNTIEASQQCERLAVPDVKEILPLRTILTKLSQTSDSVELIVCQERGQPGFIAQVLRTISTDKNVYFLIGPEGGLSADELDILATFPFVHFCNLGPNILRAETAATYALTAFQTFHLYKL